jgi:hypothetical protein
MTILIGFSVATSFQPQKSAAFTIHFSRLSRAVIERHRDGVEVILEMRITRNKRQTQYEDINDDQRHVCATDPTIAVRLSNLILYSVAI